MITGILLFFAGIAIGLWGSFGFNFGRMISGWIIAGIGVVLFISSFVRLP
jgi:hypothetical protein